MVYDTDLIVASLAFLSIIVYHFMAQKIMKLENNRSFFYLVFVGYLDLLLGTVGIVLAYMARPEYSLTTEIVVALLCLTEILAYHAMLIYITVQILPKKLDKYWLMVPMVVLPAVMILGILGNHWSGAFFTVRNGIYEKGPRFWTMYVYAGLIHTSMIVCSMRHADELGENKVAAVWELVSLIVLCNCFRTLYTAHRSEMLSGFPVTLGITVLFLTLNNPYRSMDGLTATFDSRSLRKHAEERIHRKREFHVVEITINQLKHINFVMGTEVGNQVLVATANMLMGCNKKNMVFRVSGKRFLVMCPTYSGMEKVRDTAMDFFSTTLQVGDEFLSPHAVICTIHDAHLMPNVNRILSYGDYLSKLAQWPFETCLIPDDRDTLKGFHYNLEIERFLDVALQKDLFDVVFQPVYNMQENCFTTMEALSRLTHPKLGPVSPQVFIEIAEKNDQIADIAILQLRRICRFLQDNPQIGQVFHNVKVNVSPVELLRPGHVDSMLEIIRSYQIPLSFFQFEITESTAVEHGQALDEVVERFTEAGIGLCLDDFGSGYANLNMVMKLPFHTIKLDRSLLFGICQDEKVASLYESLVVSLHKMGFVVLSEGVETDQELKLVSQWGVDMIQGFYFSKPLARRALLQTISEQCTV